MISVEPEVVTIAWTRTGITVKVTSVPEDTGVEKTVVQKGDGVGNYFQGTVSSRRTTSADEEAVPVSSVA